MSTTIQLDLPDDMLTQYRSRDDLTRHALEDIILMERHLGHLSLGRAAELLGLSYGECYDLLVARGLPIANCSQEEREESEARFPALIATVPASRP